MKRLLILTIVTASIGFITSGTASAAPTPSAATYNAGDPANGIADSRHNLGNFGNFTTSLPNIATSGINGTTEICVFCHTPHHSNTNTRNVPIWNRNNSTAASYTAYGTTLGGTTVIDYDIGSTTLACLSCHDGVTTFDNLANRPGKGIGAMTGATFWNNGSIVSNKMTSGRLNIGTDLSNDHPVSVKYTSGSPVGVASLRPLNTVISTIDVAAGLADSAQIWDGGNLTKNLWAVKGFINASATINDLLRNVQSGDYTIECSSCHDPHFNNKSWNEVDSTYGSGNQEFESNGMFLRRVGGNSGSGVCRTCHNK